MERKAYKFWFATGSQDLYGDECLRKVAEHSRIIVEGLNRSGLLPYEVIWKPTLIDNTSIRTCLLYTSTSFPVSSNRIQRSVFSAATRK